MLLALPVLPKFELFWHLPLANLFLVLVLGWIPFVSNIRLQLRPVYFGPIQRTESIG